jgi:hypothetical protein
MEKYKSTNAVFDVHVYGREKSTIGQTPVLVKDNYRSITSSIIQYSEHEARYNWRQPE